MVKNKLIIFTFLMVTSCTFKSHQYSITIQEYDSSGFNGHSIVCDSFTMLNEKSAIAWVDGRGFNIYSDKPIKVSNNN